VPLTRGADDNLGVAASGGGNWKPPAPANVVIHNYTGASRRYRETATATSPSCWRRLLTAWSRIRSRPALVAACRRNNTAWNRKLTYAYLSVDRVAVTMTLRVFDI